LMPMVLHRKSTPMQSSNITRRLCTHFQLFFSSLFAMRRRCAMRDFHFIRFFLLKRMTLGFCAQEDWTQTQKSGQGPNYLAYSTEGVSMASFPNTAPAVLQLGLGKGRTNSFLRYEQFLEIFVFQNKHHASAVAG
jgi:hypothetical protein